MHIWERLLYRVVQAVMFGMHLLGLYFPDFEECSSITKNLAEFIMCMFNASAIFVFPYYNLKYVALNPQNNSSSTTMNYSEVMYLISLVLCNTTLTSMAWIRHRAFRRVSKELLQFLKEKNIQKDLRSELRFILGYFFLFIVSSVGSFIVFKNYYITSYMIIFGKGSLLKYLLIFSFYWNVILSGCPALIYVIYAVVFAVQMKRLNFKLQVYFALGIDEKEDAAKRDANQVTSPVDLHDGDKPDGGQASSPEDFYTLVAEMETVRKKYENFVEAISPLLLAHNFFRIYAWVQICFYCFTVITDTVTTNSSFITETTLLLSFYQEASLADLIRNEASKSYRIVITSQKTICKFHSEAFWVKLQTLRSLQAKLKLLRLMTRCPLSTQIMGLYNLSRRNLLNVVPAAMSFIVIFLQFHISEISLTAKCSNATLSESPLMTNDEHI